MTSRAKAWKPGTPMAVADTYGVDVLSIKVVAQLCETRRDLVKENALLAAIWQSRKRREGGNQREKGHDGQ